MPTKKTTPTDRPCRDCKITILYIPRRVRCLDCHKVYIGEKKKNEKIEFIPEDD